MKDRRIVLITFFLAACGGGKSGSGPTTPTGVVTLTIISGSGVTDTVGAWLPAPLVVEVRDVDGTPMSRHAVHLTSLPRSGTDINPLDKSLQVSTVFSGTFRVWQDDLIDYTDSQGRLATAVRLGEGVGSARLKVDAGGSAQLVKEVQFGIEPGHAAGAHVIPADTAVYVGRSFQTRASAVDRFGNPRPDPVTVTAVTPDVLVTGRNVTGVSYSRSRIAVASGQFVDTGFVSVVPEGTLATAGDLGLSVFNLDGSGFQTLPTTVVWGWPTWAPDGLSIALGGNAQLARIPLTGQAVTIGPNDPTMPTQYAPQFSPDGQWVYFTGTNGSPRLRRVSPTGQNVGPIPMVPNGETEFAAPSPDGRSLLYVEWVNGNRGTAHVVDLQTGTIRDLGVTMFAPRWSPLGGAIAYLGVQSGPDRSVVRVINPDGTGIRTLTTGPQSFDLGLDWSPDGKWIVGYSDVIYLVEAATGRMIPLPYYTHLRVSPSWKPR